MLFYVFYDENENDTSLELDQKNVSFFITAFIQVNKSLESIYNDRICG